MPKVTIYTQVFNAKNYIEQCVNSVLHQTYTDFEYLLVDSASTDGSSEILDDFAAQDPRIRLFHLKENKPLAERDMIPKYASGEYYTALDHDDWLEPNFLEHMLSFVEENRLDVGCTGTLMHVEGTNGQHLRSLPRPMIWECAQFPAGYRWYHQFFRTRWNKLIRMEYVHQTYGKDIPTYGYGGDTIVCFRILRYAQRIGVDSSVLHHYRIHSSSQSYRYAPERFDADIYCYQDAVDFLSAFGPISGQNRLFIQQVYANAVVDTTQAIAASSLPEEEKMQEYRRIAEQPITREVYSKFTSDATFRRSREILWQALMQVDCGEDNGDLPGVVSALSPNCAGAITEDSFPLIRREPALLRAVLEDDRIALAGELLRFLAEKKYVKQYDITGMLSGLLPEASPLQIIKNKRFFGKYPAICEAILKEDYICALDQMAEQLLPGKRLFDEETFLQVFLLLAALENQADAFVLGKIRLAKLYQKTGQGEKLQGLLNELREMGAGDHDEVIELQKSLKGAGDKKY